MKVYLQRSKGLSHCPHIAGAVMFGCASKVEAFFMKYLPFTCSPSSRASVSLSRQPISGEMGCEYSVRLLHCIFSFSYIYSCID